MTGPFDDLIPPKPGAPSGGPFDDLVPPPPTIAGEFKKGVKQGVLGTKQALQGIASMAGNIAGIKPLEEWGAEGARATEEELQRPENVPAVQSIADIGGPREAALWASAGLGQLAPFMVESAVSGGLGGAAAGIGARVAAKRAGRVLAEEAAQKIATRGALAGAGLNSIGFETGSIYADQLGDQTQAPSPGRAIAAGIPAGLLDVAPEARIFSRLLGPKPGKQIGFVRDVLTQMGMEGSTEAAQNILEWMGARKDPMTPQGIMEAIDAGALGALGGGVIQAPVHLAGRLRGTREQPAPAQGEVTPPEAATAPPALPTPTEAPQIPPPAAAPPAAAIAPPPAPPAGPATRAAVTAVETGFTDTARAGTQTELDVAKAEHEQEQANAAAKEASKPQSKPGAPKPVEPEVVPTPVAAPTEAFKPAEAIKRAAIQTEQGTPSEAVVHPTQAGQAAVVPNLSAQVSQPPVSPAKTGTMLSQDNIDKATGEILPPRIKPPIAEGTVDEAAHTAATSPHNNLPAPTRNQAEAENYKVGHETLGPITNSVRVSIENPHGSERSNLDTNRLSAIFDSLPDKAPGKQTIANAIKSAKFGMFGDALQFVKNAVSETATKKTQAISDELDRIATKSWVTRMKAHYARILGTTGADGQHLDAYIKPHTPLDYSGDVFVINQQTKDGRFDEHKIMVGWDNQADAIAAYKEHYPHGFKLSEVSRLSWKEFTDWTRSGETKKPFRRESVAKKPTLAEVKAQTAATTAPIAAFKDTENNVEARVHQLPDGRFSVGLTDLDSGENVGSFRIYPAEKKDEAIAKAKAIVAKPAAETKPPLQKAAPEKPAKEPAKSKPQETPKPTREITEADLEPLKGTGIYGGATDPDHVYRGMVELLQTGGWNVPKAEHRRAPEQVIGQLEQLAGPQTQLEIRKAARQILKNLAVPAEAAAEERGATPEQTEDIGDEFESAKDDAVDDGFQVHHLFDPPAKGEVVRADARARVYHKQHGWMTVEQAKAKVDEWKANAAKQGKGKASRSANGDKVVLSFFDLTGEWSRPWEEAGYEVWRFDIQNDPEQGDVGNFSTEFFNDWFGSFEGKDVYAILSANPCTDFAVSGARHFAAKDKDGRTVESVKLVHQTLAAIEYFKPSVWAIENPVGRIERLTGLPPWRLSFQPSNFGDPYTKQTLLWGRFNADLPLAPVEPAEGSKMWAKYGGKSERTKNARSVTPEGFSYAFFQANNAIDNPVLAVANKYDRLDRALMQKAIDAGLTESEISEAVDDPYYMDLDDQAAEKALQAAITVRPAPAPTALTPEQEAVRVKLEITEAETGHAVTVELTAKEALAAVDEQITRTEALLECLSS